MRSYSDKPEIPAYRVFRAVGAKRYNGEINVFKRQEPISVAGKPEKFKWPVERNDVPTIAGVIVALAWTAWMILASATGFVILEHHWTALAARLASVLNMG